MGGLGAVLGGLGALLGASWGGLRRSWDDLGATFRADQFPIDFWIDFGRQKGCPREAFWDPKSMPKRGLNLRAKKLRLGSDLGRFCVVLGGLPGGIFIDFLLVFVLFCRNQHF